MAQDIQASPSGRRNPIGPQSLERSISILQEVGWKVTNDLTGRLSRETIDAAIEEAEFQLQPADTGEIVQAIDVLSQYSRAFNVGADLTAMSQIYYRALAGISRRALGQGLENILAQWTDSFRLPSPGVIREQTDAMVLTWTSQLNALRVARRLMGAPQIPFSTEHGDDPATAEYRAETQEITKRTVSNLKANSAAFHEQSIRKKARN